MKSTVELIVTGSKARVIVDTTLHFLCVCVQILCAIWVRVTKKTTMCACGNPESCPHGTQLLNYY